MVYGRHKDVPFTVREIEGKIIREYHFTVCCGDYYILMSDGVVHAGVGKACRFGWPRDEVVRYAERYCSYGISSSRLMSTAVISFTTESREMIRPLLRLK